MADLDDIEIQEIDPNDKLLPYIKSYLNASLEKDNRLDALYSFFLVKSYPSLLKFSKTNI